MLCGGDKNRGVVVVVTEEKVIKVVMRNIGAVSLIFKNLITTMSGVSQNQ